VLKVYCDFNDGTEDDRFWILYVGDKPLESQVSALGLKDGDRVTLFQDEGDFEVEATLCFNQTHPNFLGEKLCARVLWDTFRRLPPIG